MLKITLHVPSALTSLVMQVVEEHPYTMGILRLEGLCLKPSGDVISVMVPREAVSSLIEQLEGAGFDEHAGVLVFEERMTVIGKEASQLQYEAAGSPDDALVWPVLKTSTRGASELSLSYLAFMVLATFLAAIGLLTSSSVLIVGAMILGPEFGALAFFCVSALGRDVDGMLKSVGKLVIGFMVAIVTTSVFVWILDAAGLAPVSQISATSFEQAIVSPTVVGLVIAFIAGIAGVLTLSSSNGEALIGVLVSVTTIPAAAEISIGLAAFEPARVGDGAATLVINLGGMVVSGAITLLALRRFNRNKALKG